MKSLAFRPRVHLLHRVQRRDVFEDGPARWAGIVACLVLAVLLFRRVRVTTNATHSPDITEPADLNEPASCPN